ncbi:MAG: mandelate racemase, partial [Candidatus Hodarchaeota archaeon]
MHRRDFFAALSAAGVGAPSLPAFAQEPKSGKLKISSVEIWRLEGHREAMVGGPPRQQVNPIHIYEEHRPKPPREVSEPRSTKVQARALYLKIKTDAGLEGIYGPIDEEAAIVVDQQLKGFLAGKDPLAVETLWDQMYRSNRHARRGHYMMGISAVDNALWDMRGRYFNAPVYRLLGGPTRPEVEAYGSCNGFSLEPEAVRTRSVEVQKAGFRYQKWFFAYGPGDGMEGLRKNLELVRNLREAL